MWNWTCKSPLIPSWVKQHPGVDTNPRLSVEFHYIGFSWVKHIFKKILCRSMLCNNIRYFCHFTDPRTEAVNLSACDEWFSILQRWRLHDATANFINIPSKDKLFISGGPACSYNSSLNHTKTQYMWLRAGCDLWRQSRCGRDSCAHTYAHTNTQHNEHTVYTAFLYLGDQSRDLIGQKPSVAYGHMHTRYIPMRSWEKIPFVRQSTAHAHI